MEWDKCYSHCQRKTWGAKYVLALTVIVALLTQLSGLFVIGEQLIRLTRRFASHLMVCVLNELTYCFSRNSESGVLHRVKKTTASVFDIENTAVLRKLQCSGVMQAAFQAVLESIAMFVVSPSGTDVLRCLWALVLRLGWCRFLGLQNAACNFLN